jgi:hypothetical protein
MPLVARGRPNVAPKKVTSFRPSDEAVRMLDELEEDMGLKRSAIIELAIRDFHLRRFRGRKPPKSPGKSRDPS